MSELQDFLDALYGEKPDGLQILIWTLPDKRSTFGSSVADAARVADDAQRDVYVGAGLSPEDYGENRRCPANKIAAIPGVWIDLDFAGEGHEKPNLPPDLESVMSLLEEFPPEPTVIVHSGGGLQCWWLFYEVWTFEDDEERTEAAQFVRRFNNTFRALARDKNWDVDATHDLARVFRVPGTLNHKTDPPRPVKLEQLNGSRYHINDLETFMLDATVSDEQFPDQPTEDVPDLGITLDANANPAFDRFMLLMEADQQFAKTWNRQRRDLQDQSASTYDMSLATIAAMAGWESQEIANLMISHRRHHGDDLKLRPDYYARTITKALRHRRGVVAQLELEDLLDDNNTDDETNKDEKRELIIKKLSERFRIKIKRIVKFLSEPSSYRIETERGAVTLSGVHQLITQHQLRNKIAEAAGVVIPKMKGYQWDKVAQSLLDACVEEGLSEEATESGMIALWLEDYLQARPPIEDVDEAVAVREPFIKNEAIHIFLSSLRHWLSMRYRERLSAQALGRLLRMIGGEPTVIAYVTSDGTRTSRSVWRLPATF